MIGSNLALAVREIRKNIFRSALTILGVVIGVAAVVAIVTIGDGAAARITASFDRLGATTVIVTPGQGRGGPGRGGPGRGGPASVGGSIGRPFTLADVAAIDDLDLVANVAPTQPVPAYATTEAAQEPVVVTATTPAYFEINQIPLAAGVGVDVELDDGVIPAVLGQRVARDLFGIDSEDRRRPNVERSDGERSGPRGPRFLRDRDLEPVDPAAVIGKALDLDGTSFRVVGLLDLVEGGAFGFNHNRSILVPFEAASPNPNEPAEVGMMLVSVVDIDQMDEARSVIRQTLRTRRGLSENQRSDFSLRGVDQIIDAIQETTGTVTTAIGLIAAISLLVGGIGIMNVMLVTVTERTREIGVRIAIGAEPADVMLQFLVEACMLTTFGGVVGLTVGLIGGAVAANFLELPFVPNVWLVLGVVVFSLALGALFGFLPARRAARINPIDALRHE